MGGLPRGPKRAGGALAAAALAVLVLGACSDDGDDGAAVAGAESPEAAASAVLDAWLAGDREQVEGLGREEALDSLFELEPPEAGMELDSCQPDAALREGESCLARGGGRTIVLVVQSEPEGWRLVVASAVR